LGPLRGRVSEASTTDSMSPISITTSTRAGVDLVTVAGDVDIATHKALRDAGTSSTLTQDELVVDLNQIDFIDSMGIGALMFIARAAQRRATKLTFVCAPGRPSRRTITMTRLDTVLNLVDNL